MLTVGVDIGGTKIAAGVVDEDGAILARDRWETDPEDPERMNASITAAVVELRAAHEIGAVGVAAAGPVTSTRDVVRFAPNIAWRDYPLRERLAREIELPIVVENDANAAGWAEFQFGAGREVSHMIMVTLGTGVGGAMVLDGQLYRGAFGSAAEMGHFKVVPNGQYCGCGHPGCWESYASGKALTRAARNRAVTDPEGAAAMLALAGTGKLKGHHVTEAASRGDAASLRLLEEYGGWIGTGLASLAALLDPELFVVGGGVADSGELFIDSVRGSFQQNLFARGHRPEARVELAQLGNDAGIIGVADLARH